MPKPFLKKTRKNQTSLELSALTRAALRRIKSEHKISFTGAIKRGVFLFEDKLKRLAI